MSDAPIASVWHALRPSWWLASVFVVIGSLAITAVILLDLPLWWRLPLAFGVVIAVGWNVFHHALQKSRHSLVAFRLLRRGLLEARTQSGHIIRFALRPGSRLAGSLMVLRLSSLDSPARHQSLVLLPDALCGDAERLLRIWLKWHADEGPASA